MSCWSAENATKAFLKTMNMGKRPNEPNGAEFISALAAGNNAQIMVVACANVADSTTLALVAAAQQTRGRVICILRGIEELHLSKMALGMNSSHLEFVVANSQTLEMLLPNYYKDADFISVDCNIQNHEEILGSLRKSRRNKSTIVLGYNAFCKESWKSSPLRTQLLPIGEGLLLTRIAAKMKVDTDRGHWIVKVDKCTGEEHVYRVKSPRRRVVEA
ncbi:hypothetical protein R3W88_008635 [Solanum pinnatisectum]|uniref:Uncharacterized protein n=1 Tax=Solanum pinnatisectum TaxID=50273 RepID=A0AAV9MBQ9_9SOLN|nr:hypothetical protein R3W88_008635 [Solanum pinnatisectum]